VARFHRPPQAIRLAGHHCFLEAFIYSSHAQTSHQLVGIGEIRPHQWLQLVGNTLTMWRSGTGTHAEQLVYFSKAMIFSKDQIFSKSPQLEGPYLQCEVQLKKCGNATSLTSLGSITRSIVHGPWCDDTFVQTWFTLNVQMNVHVPQRHSDRSIPPNEQSIKCETIYYRLNNSIWQNYITG